MALCIEDGRDLAATISDATRWLHTNRCYHACPLDAQCLWAAWVLAAPLRLYGPDRRRWITLVANKRRSQRLWDQAERVEVAPPRTRDDQPAAET